MKAHRRPAELTAARLDWIREKPGTAWYLVNAENRALIALYAKFGFLEQARGPRICGVEFGGGMGVLGPSVDPTGSARRDRDLRFELRIEHVGGAAAVDHIEDVLLEWSTDQGSTWHDAAIRRTGAATFVATIKAKRLADGDTVGVRLSATDSDGNAIDQTTPDLVPLH